MARYPDAIWRASPKHGYPSTDTHANEGVVIHSAEGSLAAALGVIDGPREASWHFFVCKDGKVYQFIDSTNIAWTNGSFESNRRFWGIENEGIKGEALTEPQYAALKDLVKWLFVGPYIRGQTLWEHREMTAYGSLPTACPSGRIPWARLIAALEEEEMTDLEFMQILERVVGNPGFIFRLPVDPGQPPREGSLNGILASIAGDLHNLYTSAAAVQDKIAALEMDAPAVHTHETGPPK